MEHKYDVGDEVLIKAKVIALSSDGSILVQYPDNESNKYWVSPHNMQPYTEPAPVVWRDGAVERPETTETALLMNRSIVCCLKEKMYDFFIFNLHCSPNQITHINWSKHFWLYIDEFPMPSIPKPKIEPCPVCGSTCVSSAETINDIYMDVIYCTDDNCVYRIGTLEKHNKLCQKVRHAQD